MVRRGRAERAGFAVAFAIAVILVLGVLAAGLYSRYVIVSGDVQRLQQETTARQFADSVLELLTEQARRNALSNGQRFELVGGAAGYVLGDITTPPEGAAYRPALVFVNAGGARKELFLHLIENAPRVAGGAPVPGRTQLDEIQDITGMLNLPSTLPQVTNRAPLLAQAAAAAKQAAVR
jgi:hypothetical protein